MTEIPGFNPEKQEITRKVLVERIIKPAREMVEIKGMDPEVKKIKSVLANQILENLGFKAQSVEELLAVKNDANKTEKQKKLAENSYDILAEGMAKVLGEEKNEETQKNLWTGSVSQIEANLPEELKGVGKGIVEKTIKDEKMREVLGKLENQRSRNQDKEEMGKRVIEKKLAEAYEQINDMDLGAESEKERETIMTYLAREGEEISEVESKEKGSTPYFDVVKKIIDANKYTGKTSVGGQEGGVGGMDSLGVIETMEGIPKLEIKSENFEEEIRLWAAESVDWIAREQLVFGGAGWQQFSPAMEREVRKVMKSSRKNEVDINKGLEIVRAVWAPRIYEEAMMHADGAIGILVKTLPPAGIYEVNEWNTERREILLFNTDKEGKKIPSLVQEMYLEIFDEIELCGVSTKKEKGEREVEIGEKFKSVLSKLADSEKSNIMAEELANKFTVKYSEKYSKKELQSLARTAISIFNVDNMPDVIMWLNNVYIDNEKVIKENGKLKGRRMDGERVIGEVNCYDSKINDNLKYIHPLVSLRRPVDVYRQNNVWNEAILREAEQALWYFGEKVFLKDDKKDFPWWSSINIKKLDRWDSMMSAFFGGTQAESLDNFADLEKGLDKMQKLLQPNENMANIGGAVAAKIIKVKTMALLVESRKGFSSNLTRALAIEKSSVPKEMSEALGKMTGSGMDTSFGSIKEAIGRLGFNFTGSKDLAIAIDMLVTETRDPEKASQNLKYKKVAMVLKSILDLSVESSGGKKR